MPGQRLPMRKIRDVLRLSANGMSKRQIAASLGISATAAGECIRRARHAGLLAPYIMGSVIESATTPLDGFNTGFFMCGVIMLVGGGIAMALVNPEREAKRRSRRLQPLTASI